MSKTPALDYLRSLVGESTTVAKTEQEAIQFLIKSHEYQREYIREEVRKYLGSSAGKAWRERVENMNLQECFDWFKENKC